MSELKIAMIIHKCSSVKYIVEKSVILVLLY